MTAVSHPPLAAVSEIVADFQRRGWPVAVGGSAVLAAFSLIDSVRDWDITVEAAPTDVVAALREAGFSAIDATSVEAPFATALRLTIVLSDHEIDVLVGFALRDGDRIVDIPVRVSTVWNGLPIAHPADWELAYRLMGRENRANALRLIGLNDERNEQDQARD